MSRLLPVILIFVVALTSIGLGTARGTLRMGDEVVLCTGHGIVVTRLPADPGETVAYLCPDMALSLLAATAPPDISTPARPDLPQVLPARAVASPAGTAERPVRVRDPPGPQDISILPIAI